MEKLFDALHCPEEWRVGFARLYLMGKADLCWATVRSKQQEFGLGWSKFKKLLKNDFYLVSLQKAKEDEFVHLQ